MSLIVRVAGLVELESKLGGKLIQQPELEDALDSVAKRAARGGRGLGARRNPITIQAGSLSRVAVTSLNNPRTKGTSWLNSNMRKFLPPVARNAINKVARNIAARWAS